MEKEIELYKKINDPVAAALQLGTVFARSGLFGCSKEEQGQVLALTCLAENKTPLEVLRTFHIISTKNSTNLSMRADAMLARFRERGGKCQWLETTDKVARARFIYDGNDVERQYTIDQVKTMEKTGQENYKRWPAAMLRARLVSETMRMIAPEIVAGVYTPEELDAPNKPAEVKMANAVEVTPTEPQNEEAEIAQLEEILEPYAGVADKFFLEKKLIQEGQNFRDLSPENRRKVFENKTVLVRKLAEMLDEKTNKSEVVEAEVGE
jgi:hypothetical protein